MNINLTPTCHEINWINQNYEKGSGPIKKYQKKKGKLRSYNALDYDKTQRAYVIEYREAN